jgi:hypothetical protein
MIFQPVVLQRVRAVRESLRARIEASYSENSAVGRTDCRNAGCRCGESLQRAAECRWLEVHPLPLLQCGWSLATWPLMTTPVQWEVYSKGLPS